VPHSPIDAKKTGTTGKESATSKSSSLQLTDKDIFGNETTLAVSEEDIQAALEEDEFRVPLNSKVILVQSGSRAPETVMQQEMSQYYSVATFSGIPDRQKVVSCNKEKDENSEATIAENMNWMQALRYIAAKGHQKAIIVYQDLLQSGKYDPTTKNTIWSDYKNEKLTDTTSLRYLVRFTLVDVATGEWATWSPVNYEYNVTIPQTNKKEIIETTDQQVSQLKQRTYALMVKDLVNRYQ
jgi:predicted transcriptional regulator